MRKLLDANDLKKYLSKAEKKNNGNNKHTILLETKPVKRLLTNLLIKDIHIDNLSILILEFHNCEFRGVSFKNNNISSVIHNCIFVECYFLDNDFSDTTINLTKFIDCEFIKTQFSQVSSFYGVFFSGTYFNDCNVRGSFGGIRLEKTRINNSRFTSHSANFIDCDIKNSTLLIYGYDVTFRNCELSYNFFNDSVITSNTFRACKKELPNFIDLQSLAKSKQIPSTILKELFNITSHDAQDYVRDFFTEIKYETVFISFSYKNEIFAKKIRQELFDKGVRTWFWPEDAPGGKRTKDIMYKGIQDNDRVIFICSQDSLKSAACHYELSEARKKEGKLWKEVLFPIAIDHTIFDIEFIRNIHKYEKKNAEDWIANIDWLKEYNILLFGEFNKTNFDEDKFSKAIENLIKDLRKNQP